MSIKGANRSPKKTDAHPLLDPRDTALLPHEPREVEQVSPFQGGPAIQTNAPGGVRRRRRWDHDRVVLGGREHLDRDWSPAVVLLPLVPVLGPLSVTRGRRRVSDTYSG